MNWPIYFKDKLHIANIKSNIGIVTLWTPMQAILPNLNQNMFSIGGQLYSKMGINYIIRNILANPSINTLIVCGANRSESAEALINFFHKGIDKDNNVVGVDKAIVDKQIDLKSLSLLRDNIKLINLVGISSASSIQKEIEKNHKEIKNWSKPQVFEEPEKVSLDKFPSEATTYEVKAEYIHQALPQMLRLILKFGSKKGMIKQGEVKELVNLICVIEKEDPDKPEIPSWFSFNKEDLKLYYKGFFSKTADTEDYGYGQRIFSYPLGVPLQEYNSKKNLETHNEFKKKVGKIFNSDDFVLDQLEEIYQKLKRYKYDRGALISIWNPWIDNVSKGWMSDQNVKQSGNVPCMTQLQFSYRDHKLHLTAYFRSNDIYDAWPRNAFALRKLQFLLSEKLDMKVGNLATISSLAQIYEPNWDNAQKMVDKFNNITNCRVDQRGVVVIENIKDKIVVRHLDKTGNIELECFEVDGKLPKAAQKMSDILLTNLVFSELPHAMDIARELQKAELAIKNDLKYVQDQELKL